MVKNSGKIFLRININGIISVNYWIQLFAKIKSTWKFYKRKMKKFNLLIWYIILIIHLQKFHDDSFSFSFS